MSTFSVNLKTLFHQDLFARGVCAEIQPDSLHILIAPYGSGKRMALADTISRLKKQKNLSHFLIVSAIAETDSWAKVLLRWGQDSHDIDGQQLRMTLQSHDATEISNSGIHIVKYELLQKPDFLEILCSVPWNFVVLCQDGLATEEHLSLLKKFSQSSNCSSLLVCNELEETLAASSNGTITDWRVVLSNQAQEDPFPIRRDVLRFRRTSDEIVVAEGVVKLAKETENKHERLKLIHHAISSASTLADSIVNVIHMGIGDEDLKVEAESLLNCIDALSSDSKLSCFSIHVHNVLSSSYLPRILVCCEYRSTLEYVYSSFENKSFPVYKFLKNRLSRFNFSAVEQFNATGGLMFITSESMGNVHFPLIDSIVHYDLPLFASTMDLRESFLRRRAKKENRTIYVFRDYSETFLLESRLADLALSFKAYGYNPGYTPSDLQDNLFDSVHVYSSVNKRKLD